jgi:capsular polysaccharide biosynthesis protein
VDPRIAARAMVAVVLVAVGVAGASLMQTPTYEASAQVWVDQGQGAQQTNWAGSGEMIKTLPPPSQLQELTLMVTYAIDSRPVAEEAIQRLELEMTPAELLDNLTVEQVENTGFIVLSYEDTNPVRAKYIANAVGEVSSELISESSAAGSNITATLYDKAIIPSSVASPHPWRNGLLTLVMGLGLCAGVALALPGVAASVAGKLGGPAVSQGIGQAGLPFAPSAGPSRADVIKEKELLLALGRCGKLTAVEAALESSLSVEEADRMLSELAAKGHLEVTVEHGRLHYALWEEHDAPP